MQVISEVLANYFASMCQYICTIRVAARDLHTLQLVFLHLVLQRLPLYFQVVRGF
jgi:hypothetical protein